MENPLLHNAEIMILGFITALKAKGNIHAITFMRVITATMPEKKYFLGKNQMKWRRCDCLNTSQNG